MLARRQIQSAWQPLVIHILLPLITRSSLPGRVVSEKVFGEQKPKKVSSNLKVMQ